jgi:hypothetical protein
LDQFWQSSRHSNHTLDLWLCVPAFQSGLPFSIKVLDNPFVHYKERFSKNKGKFWKNLAKIKKYCSL